jgi:hypothetical protein
MDLYCPKCGEPWDFDSLHDEAQARYGIPYYTPEPDRYAMVGPGRRTQNPEYDETAYQRVFSKVRQEFQTQGCEAMREAFGAKCSTPSTDTDRTFGLTRQEAASTLYELLGDDMDGAAAMLDDLSW